MSTPATAESGAVASLQLAGLAELVARLGQADGLEEIARLLAEQARWVVPNDRCTLLVLEDADGPGATFFAVLPGGPGGETELHESSMLAL
jgi:GAF domain-containing protein